MIILSFTTTLGEEKQFLYYDDEIAEVREIRLDHHDIESINLNALSSFSNLEVLDLSHNRLHRIDPTPLASCKNLLKLDLSHNHLLGIRLGSLKYCKKLEELNLNGNYMRKISLSSLGHLSKLRKLGLQVFPDGGFGHKVFRNPDRYDPEYAEFDLSPLSACMDLESLDLPNVQHKWLLEITPLLACPKLSWENWPEKAQGMTFLQQMTADFVFPKTVNAHGFGWKDGRLIENLAKSQLRTISRILTALSTSTTNRWKLHSISHDIINQIHPHFTGFLIHTPKLIHHLAKSRKQQRKTITELRDELKSSIKKLQLEQISEGGTTIGLDIQSLVNHPETVKLVPQLLENRKVEIENVAIFISSDIADLRSLWVTAYGYEILSSMKLPTWCKKNHIEQIQQCLNETGLKLNIVYCDDQASEDIDEDSGMGCDTELIPIPHTITQSMCEYIWRRVDYETYWQGNVLFKNLTDIQENWYRGVHSSRGISNYK